jgi:PilZ domain
MNLSAPQELRPQEQRVMVARPVRHQVCLPLKVTHHVFVGTRCTECVCTDINEHGMGVDISQPLSVGEIVKLDLELPSDPFYACARVIYRKQHHCGLYFVDLTPDQRQNLSEIVGKWQSDSKHLVQ